MTPKIVPVILSGGAGSRLWPMSTTERPKPFMTMPDGETLLEKTIKRASAMAPDGPIFTVTGRSYFELTQAEYRRVGVVNEARLHYVLEPSARNTAPAIAMAMACIGRQFGSDCIAAIMPSDHLIGDDAAFGQALAKAAELALAEYLVTFGIVPDRPETGYGYVQAGDMIKGGHQVAKFVEKPDRPTAERYLVSGQYLWNSGMFCFTPAGFFRALGKVDKPFAEATEACLAATPDTAPTRLDGPTFACLPATSVDYALMEKSDRVAVVPADIGWNDVGSWDAIAALAGGDAQANAFQGTVFNEGGTNCFVVAGDRTVALVGVSDLVVIETADATLIAQKNSTQRLKALVNLIKNVKDLP